MKNIIKNTFVIFALLQGVIWIIFGIFTISNQSQSIFVAFFMFANGLLFASCAFLFNKGLFFKIFIIGFICINLILTVTDQMGVYDYIILVLNIISLSTFIYIMSK